MSRALPPLIRQRLTGDDAGVPSVCSAHPLVVEAALARGVRTGRRVLIEATCHQVNQDGGYTGMTPADFRRFVETIAARVGFDAGRIILGGDHLGPNPWKHLPAAEAMPKAKAMIEAFARAGFAKLHLDTSMGCAGEPAALPDAASAERAAALAGVAEAATSGGLPPVYVIGTEVPVPGGAEHPLGELAVTRPEAALHTIETHRQAFRSAGLEQAFARAIGIVVQPGVEFASTEVVAYQPMKARELSATLDKMPEFVFEAHSTDYQPAAALDALVRDGFAILKVGPWLTFALREALYGLDAIARVVDPASTDEGLPAALERLLLKKPENWRSYYSGNADELKLQRHFSYSDRIRYYWPQPEAQAALDRLFARLGDRPIPAPLVSQYIGALYPAVAEGSLAPRPRALVIGAVQRVLALYDHACRRNRERGTRRRPDRLRATAMQGEGAGAARED